MRSRCMLLTAVLSLNGNMHMADVEGGSAESESHETLSHHSSDGDLSMQYSSSPFESDTGSTSYSEVSNDTPEPGDHVVEPYTVYEPEDDDPPSDSSNDESTSHRLGNNNW